MKLYPVLLASSALFLILLLSPANADKEPEVVTRRLRNGRIVRVRSRPRSNNVRPGFGNRVRGGQRINVQQPVQPVITPAPVVVNPFLRKVVQEEPVPAPIQPVVFEQVVREEFEPSPIVEQPVVFAVRDDPAPLEPQQLFAFNVPQVVTNVRAQQPTPVAPVQFVRRVAPAATAAPVPFVRHVVHEERQQPAETTSFLSRPTFSVPATAAGTRRRGKQSEQPNVAIIRSVYNAPGTLGYERAFDYSFEAENGIKQEAYGEMRTVGDTDVMVMRGNYQYTGPDGNLYQMNWYADETGYHAEAEHLPRNVPIPFPEIQAAVDAQLRFAAEQDASGGVAVDVY